MRLTFLLGLLVLALTAEAAKLKVTFLPTCLPLPALMTAALPWRAACLGLALIHPDEMK